MTGHWKWIGRNTVKFVSRERFKNRVATRHLDWLEWTLSESPIWSVQVQDTEHSSDRHRGGWLHESRRLWFCFVPLYIWGLQSQIMALDLDLKVWLPLFHPTDSLCLQRELEKLNSWFKGTANFRQLNVETQMISFSPSSDKLVLYGKMTTRSQAPHLI